jgi:hypothetical protein
MKMIEVSIFGELSEYWIVQYGNTLYLMLDQDLLFQGNKVYTYPYKLRQEYHVRQSNSTR